MQYRILPIIVLLIGFQFSALAQVTNLFDDFEGSGTVNTWFGDNCDMDISLTNPYQQGDNTSATVMEYHDVGGQYANVQFTTSTTFDLTTYATFSLKIYVPSSGITGNSPNQIALKLQDGALGNSSWTTQCEIIKPIVLDQWQTITFDFANDSYINLDPASLPPTQRTDFSKIVIQVNGENNTDHVLAYLDDFLYDETTTPPPTTNYTLIWSDEFDIDGAVDPLKWHHQTVIPNGNSWFNGEIQHYTNRIDNAEVSNGTLKIIAKKETYTNQGITKQHTSARLNSKFAFKYGKVEIKAKLPSGAGTWPALWTLGKNITETGAYWQTQGFGTTSWPACGELDIMEHWGTNQNFVQSAIHTPSSHGNTVNKGGRVVGTASSAFHVYTMEWTEDKVKFSIDGIPHYTYEPPIKDASTWPFDAEQYLIFNVAILPSIASNFTQAAMEIDYVRVYEEDPVSTQQIEAKAPLNYFPNPVDDVLHITLEEKSGSTATVNIFTIDGKLVKSNQVITQGSQLTIKDLKRLNEGLYFITIHIDTSTYRLKFIKG